ncbi:peptidylprolyl isomerase [Tichowtungia aerotolerans]|uniref:PpiC domain-containing protein n=1 Tax=Tichowtungia aerotolerans TaxID=2697043 RepID=A0A6P1M2K2_9BACT|nr:peptidylprolyl isomerase [Tichowtungia aerotolerans]QHI68057.1 hypothetical protein GT409_00845 [Tichowtungia aerotolerans]
MKISVNGEAISPEVIQREVQNYRQKNLGANEKEAFDAVSSQMVDWTLIRQVATEKGPEVSAEEIEAGFERLCRSHGGREQFFQRFGLSEDRVDEVKLDVERNCRITKFLDELSKDVSAPAEDTVVAYYKEHKSEFVHPEKVHSMHIVKHPQDEASEQAAAAELTNIRQRLLAGEDFMTVANETSECNDTSPDLGEFARGQMVPEFELVVFSMQVGEISPVFKTQFGLHIATVTEKTAAAPMSLADCRARIEEILQHDLKNDAIGRWVDAEKERAEIEVSAE